MSDEAIGLSNDLGVTNVEPDQIHYAGFWIRLAAGLIDGIILGVVISLVKITFLTTYLQDVPVAERGLMYPILGSILQFSINLLYECCFLSSAWMSTPGMKAVGIKIVDYNDNRISFSRAFVRCLYEILSVVILMIGFLMIAFDSRKQALHDKLAKTFVIYTKTSDETLADKTENVTSLTEIPPQLNRKSFSELSRDSVEFWVRRSGSWSTEDIASALDSTKEKIEKEGFRLYKEGKITQKEWETALGRCLNENEII
jgi:uncharacterized RDD family membrane protein YckC